MKLNFGFMFSLFLIYFSQVFAIPVITTITPNSGPSSGGNTITVLGSSFTGTTAVNFDTIPAASFLVNSDSSISVVVPPASAGSFNVIITASSGTSLPTHSSLYVFKGDWFAYVCIPQPFISKSVTPIDLPSNAPGTPISMTASPFGIAITPNARVAYTTFTNTSEVGPVDLTTNTAESPIFLDAGSSIPFHLAITPDGKTAYIGDQGNNQIIPIDVASNSEGIAIPIGANPLILAITPDGSRLYVTTTSNIIEVIDLPSNTLGLPIILPPSSNPFGISITPDGTKAYVVLSKNPGELLPINIPLNTLDPTIPITGSNAPRRFAITPDGIKAHVLGNSQVFPIDLVSQITGTPIPVGSGPDGIAVTPDGKTAYISSFNDNIVTPIDIATQVAGIPIALNGACDEIAITPDQAPVAFFTTNTNSVPLGLPVTFDASLSVSPVGTIVSYFWDFGDGQTATVFSPTTTHSYLSPGTYTVTLTVTNSAGTSTKQVFTGRTMHRNGGPNAVTTQVINVNQNFNGTNLTGKVIRNKFLTQIDYIHELKWDPSPSPPVIGYRIFRNGQLIATVGTRGPLVYLDYNRKKNVADIYQIVAFTALGIESTSLFVKVPESTGT